jgi:hypothetical protein
MTGQRECNPLSTVDLPYSFSYSLTSILYNERQSNQIRVFFQTKYGIVIGVPWEEEERESIN